MWTKNKKGFTLAELLIVVAIIAVLVAISIPIFSSQLEKSRRAVDLSNARNIESTLLYALMDGELKLDDDQVAYVYVNRNYPCDCKVTKGGSKGTTTTDEFQNLVKKSGIVTDDLRVKCRNVDNGGWYWYCFYVYGNGEHGFISSTNNAVKEDRFMWDPTTKDLNNIIANNANFGGQNMQNAIHGNK